MQSTYTVAVDLRTNVYYTAAFDAFALKPNGKPDVKQNIGGVPLGLKIAEDIFAAGNKKAPKKSTVGPRP